MAKRTSEQIIVGMFNDLKMYSKSAKANPKVVKAKEFFINEVKYAFEEKDKWIEQLEDNNEKLLKVNFSLKNNILKLEAIALLHGINDLPRWMAKDFNLLVEELKTNEKFSMVQIPDRLLDNQTWRDFYNSQMKKIINEY